MGPGWRNMRILTLASRMVVCILAASNCEAWVTHPHSPISTLLHRQAPRGAVLARRNSRPGEDRRGTALRMAGGGGAGGMEGLGLAAALLSPAAGAAGMLVWDDKWRGQVFALNLVKGLIASLVFLAVLVATSSLPSLSGASPLFASAFLGIVVGDCVWLAALRRLGTRRLLLFDCLRPVVAAIAGAISLGEPLTARTAAGISLVISGVYIGSSTDQQEADQGKGLPKLDAAGLALACAHLSLDMGGQFITKTGHGAYSSLQINFLRFGSATAFLLLTKLAVYCCSSIFGKPQPTWSRMPSVEEMGRPVLSDRWRATIMATVLVTNIAPWLFVSSLIRLPLGLASTLSCLGPLYEPPLALAVRGTPMKQSAVLGGLLAVLGVAVLTLKL